MTISKHKEGETSYLLDETDSMDAKRRALEQQGLRALLRTKVHAKDHPATTLETGLMNESLSDGLEKHPLLDSQLFDGIDLNPSDPRLDPEARRKIENKQRDQNLEKQLRHQKQLQLTNQLDYRPTFDPKPRGP